MGKGERAATGNYELRELLNYLAFSGVFRGATGRCPPWPKRKKFLNTLNPKFFFKFLGRLRQGRPRHSVTLGFSFA